MNGTERLFAPMPPDEERALSEGLSRGEGRAQNLFVERTHETVYRMAARFSPDPELRQDWTHDVLLRVMEEMQRGRFIYRHPGCFWSWFGKRARFLLLDRVKKRQVEYERHLDGEESEDALSRVLVEDGNDPSAVLEELEAREAVDRCVEKVPNPDHRRALVLQMMEELPYEEIAQAMQTPLNTVRSWIRRARASVQRCVSLAYGIDTGEDHAG